MAVTPIYSDRLGQTGCGNEREAKLSQKVTALQEEVDDLEKTVEEIKQTMDSAQVVADFAGNPSFMALPVKQP